MCTVQQQEKYLASDSEVPVPCFVFHQINNKFVACVVRYFGGSCESNFNNSNLLPPAESNNAILHLHIKMTYGIDCVCHPLWFFCIFIPWCKEKIIADESRERRGPRLAPVEAASRTEKYRVNKCIVGN